MLTQIVLLYMIYQFNLPTWCSVITWIGIGLNFINLIYKTYKIGKES